jgi:hypothetical protein
MDAVIGDTHVAQCKILGRPAFLHYGTEVADGAIVENTAWHGCRRVDTHAAFARGRETWVQPTDATYQERLAIAARAESLEGRYFYSLTRNNCEHVANWCAKGVAYSQQVIDFVRRALGVAHMIGGAILALLGFAIITEAFGG